MTGAELARALAVNRGLPLKVAEEVVDVFIATLSEALIEGGTVELRGFGTFYVRDADAYTARNPQTGEPVDVPARRMAAFRPASGLREKVNRDRLGGDDT